MFYRIALLGLSVLVPCMLRANTVFIDDGDVAGLIAAVNSPDTTTPPGGFAPGLKVVLARRGTYMFSANGPSLRPLQSLTVSGRGALFTVDGMRQHPFVTAQTTAGLTTRFFDIRVEHVHSAAGVLFQGPDLYITGGTFNDIVLSTGTGGGKAALFSGGVAGRFLTVSHITLSGPVGASRSVFGDWVDLVHATVTQVSGEGPGAVFAGVGSVVEASVLADNSVRLCLDPVMSRGDNIVDDDSCGLEAPRGMQAFRDRLVAEAGLLPLDSTLGRLPVHPLSLSSPALDSGDVCHQVFQFVVTEPFDGNGDGIVACDSGAFEMPRYSVAQGDANGLFFQQNDDGHYVSVQHTGANRYLVNWYTFDQDGNQAMVFAVGARIGNLISGDAFISMDGHLEPGAGPVGQAVQPWGRIKIKLRACTNAVFQYHSDLSRFGSGLFVLDRLAFADDVNCGVSP